MPAKEIEIPIAFPDRRSYVVKMSPKANVLDLKRKIAKTEAVDVLEAGANADLLGKRYTAPAAFRLICRGLELNPTGSLEYYHLTTKGRQQQAIRVTPKHESLIDDEEIMNEDYSVPETVAHLEDEVKQKEEEEEKARQEAKKRLQTFHQKGGGAKKRAGSAASSAANSPSKNPSDRPPRTGAAASRPTSVDRVTSATSLALRSTANNTPSVLDSTTTYNRNQNIPTPDPTNPNKQLDMMSNTSASAIEQQQKQVMMNTANPNYAQRHHLPPMGDVSHFARQQGLTFREVVVPNSPTRGLAPMDVNTNTNNTSSITQYSNNMLNHQTPNNMSRMNENNHNNNNNSTDEQQQQHGGMMYYQHQQQGQPGAALFALPLEDASAPMKGGGVKNSTKVSTTSSGNSPDIIKQMKSYLRAAEKGDAPLPHVLPLPSATGFTPPRNHAVGSNNNNNNNHHTQNSLLSTSPHVNNHTNMMMNMDLIQGACGGNSSECQHAQHLQKAEERIKQLEATVDRYKNLLHRLTQIESAQQQEQQGQQNNNNNNSNNKTQQQPPRRAAQTPNQLRTQPKVQI